MTPAPDVPRPQASPFWRAVMRLTATIALALFLAPTVYVVKYYALDRPRETARARQISIAALAPTVSVNAVAPPLAPALNANAAQFYVPAIQSFATRANGGGSDHLLLIPTAREAALLLRGARCTQCRFFAQNDAHQPRFVFHDPDDNKNHPYQPPVSDRDPYRYLSDAGALARAARNLALLPGNPYPPAALANAIVRFGAGLEADGATRTHIAVSTAVQRLGLRLMRAHPPAKFQQYIDSRQTYDDAVQAKYALLEPVNPDNIALQERVARTDISPLWRREALWALGASLSVPGVSLRRPLEALSAKATLGTVAARDTDPSVRAAAATVLGMVAERGAVIQR